MDSTLVSVEPDENGCGLTLEQRKHTIEHNRKLWDDALARPKFTITMSSLEKMGNAREYPPSQSQKPPSFLYVSSLIFRHYGNRPVESQDEAKAIAHHIFCIWKPYMNGGPPLEEFAQQAGDVRIPNKKALIVYIYTLLCKRRQLMENELGFNGQPKVGEDSTIPYIGKPEIAPNTIRGESTATRFATYNNPMAIEGIFPFGSQPWDSQWSLGVKVSPYISPHMLQSHIHQMASGTMPRTSQFLPHHTWLKRQIIPYAGPRPSQQHLIDSLTMSSMPQVQGQHTGQGISYVGSLQHQQSNFGGNTPLPYPSHCMRYLDLEVLEGHESFNLNITNPPQSDIESDTM
ncbi:hypothetical protein BJ875DRAFT_445900 [Amylocarpus encephaloides]|uniref:Uncharacterized protein n=1 Tax=Amylocarpus encephaloides TaxID=45428 RepID=A0A9P7Y9T5_9HELO|nr:hypothetical protein BJ875DRAFT_445900 [Amylocarpus encephaloides]